VVSEKYERPAAGGTRLTAAATGSSRACRRSGGGRGGTRVRIADHARLVQPSRKRRGGQCRARQSTRAPRDQTTDSGRARRIARRGPRGRDCGPLTGCARCATAGRYRSGRTGRARGRRRASRAHRALLSTGRRSRDELGRATARAAAAVFAACGAVAAGTGRADAGGMVATPDAGRPSQFAIPAQRWALTMSAGQSTRRRFHETQPYDHPRASPSAGSAFFLPRSPRRAPAGGCPRRRGRRPPGHARPPARRTSRPYATASKALSDDVTARQRPTNDPGLQGRHARAAPPTPAAGRLIGPTLRSCPRL